ncbi:hypothetical protein BLOT_015624 [Blomia tropicalis]|nr:hypothetical protein BLOT_015624 [Blomia tropicalis]
MFVTNTLEHFGTCPCFVLSLPPNDDDDDGKDNRFEPTKGNKTIRLKPKMVIKGESNAPLTKHHTIEKQIARIQQQQYQQRNKNSQSLGIGLLNTLFFDHFVSNPHPNSTSNQNWFMS